MKIGLVCDKCIEEGNPTGVAPSRKVFVDVQDVGIYEFVCPRGHKTSTLLMDFKHELLFESGAIALMDGFAREAVVSFAAGVERLHEFVLRAILKAHKIKEDDINATWKQTKQTERQLGAFLFLFLMSFGEPPPIFAAKWTNFRNEVAHAGFIPTVAETTEYADYCLAYAFELLRRLATRHSAIIPEMLREHVQQTEAKAGKDRPRATHLRHVLIQTHAANHEWFGKTTVREWIEEMRNVIRPSARTDTGTSL